MSELQKRITEIKQDKRRFRVFLYHAGGFVLLIVLLCIFIVMYMNIHARYAGTRTALRDRVYTQLQDMVERYDGRNDPDMSLQRIVIPEMRADYRTALQYNTFLKERFGSSAAILSDELIESFNKAFGEFITAYNNGTTTGLAEADMLLCINAIREPVQAYFLPATTDVPPVTLTYGQ